MKIFIIGNTASNFFLFRKDFVKECINRGYEVYALVSEYDDFWINKISDIGAKVIKYKLSRTGLNPISDFKTMLELRSYIEHHKPDLVFSFFTKPVIYGSLAARLSNTRSIVGMIEGLGSPFTQHPNGQSFKMKCVKFFQISLYRIVFPFLNKIIFLNNDDPKELIYDHKIFTKKNAVEVLGGIGLNLNDYAFSEWKSHNGITFLIVARLLVEKGINEFIEAAKVVKINYPNVKFKVVGGLDISNPSALNQDDLNKIIDTGLIEYIPFTNNVQKEIRESAVFVLPSYREGMPRSTQEAMAMGRPVITTDTPGCRDTVINGLNGFLVPKWDIASLAERMEFFLKNPDQINVMGYQSHKIATEKFDVNKVNLKLFNILGLDQ